MPEAYQLVHASLEMVRIARWDKYEGQVLGQNVKYWGQFTWFTFV